MVILKNRVTRRSKCFSAPSDCGIVDVSKFAMIAL